MGTHKPYISVCDGFVVMRITASIALVLGIFFSAPSLAATVEPIRGRTSINQGDGTFHPVTGRLEAIIGDAVMVSPGGMARILYGDGCVVDVHPGAVVTITGQPPCKDPANNPSENSSNQFSVGGAVAVGGGITGAIILFLLNNKDDKPASP